MQAGWRLLHHVTLSYQDELYGYLEQQALQRSIPVAANLLICSSAQSAAVSSQQPARLMMCLTRVLSLRGLCCRGGGVTHHSILSYQERLYGYLEQLALQQTAAAATLPSGQRAASREAEDPASLFRQAPSPRAENPLLDEFGRFAGA